MTLVRARATLRKKALLRERNFAVERAYSRLPAGRRQVSGYFTVGAEHRLGGFANLLIKGLLAQTRLAGIKYA
jgi:hypothetical protein